MKYRLPPLVFLMLCLSGCGSKGPLYLPPPPAASAPAKSSSAPPAPANT